MNSRAEWDLAVHQRACKGNAEALDFLYKWCLMVHKIDDVIDEKQGPEEFLAAFGAAIEVYSHTFYLKNLAALRSMALMVTSTYADSVAMERSGVGWQEQWADYTRHVGKDMVLAVASICGGYETLRSVSQELNAMCFTEHRLGEQNPLCRKNGEEIAK